MALCPFNTKPRLLVTSHHRLHEMWALPFLDHFIWIISTSLKRWTCTTWNYTVRKTIRDRSEKECNCSRFLFPTLLIISQPLISQDLQVGDHWSTILFNKKRPVLCFDAALKIYYQYIALSIYIRKNNKTDTSVVLLCCCHHLKKYCVKLYKQMTVVRTHHTVCLVK